MRPIWLSLAAVWIASIAGLWYPTVLIVVWPFATCIVFNVIGELTTIGCRDAVRTPRIVDRRERAASDRDEPVLEGADRRTVRMILGAVLAVAAIGLAAALVPSVEYREQPAEPLSSHLAPLMWLAIVIGAVRALATMSPRRIAIAAAVILGTWPVWLALYGLSFGEFDDREHDLVTRWALPWLLVSASAVAVCGIGLGVIARRAWLAAEICGVVPRAVARVVSSAACRVSDAEQ